MYTYVVMIVLNNFWELIISRNIDPKSDGVNCQPINHFQEEGRSLLVGSFNFNLVLGVSTWSKILARA